VALANCAASGSISADAARNPRNCVSLKLVGGAGVVGAGAGGAVVVGGAAVAVAEGDAAALSLAPSEAHPPKAKPANNAIAASRQITRTIEPLLQRPSICGRAKKATVPNSVQSELRRRMRQPRQQAVQLRPLLG
jgi:hypothetical protein